MQSISTKKNGNLLQFHPINKFRGNFPKYPNLRKCMYNLHKLYTNLCFYSKTPNSPFLRRENSKLFILVMENVRKFKLIKWPLSHGRGGDGTISSSSQICDMNNSKSWGNTQIREDLGIQKTIQKILPPFWSVKFILRLELLYTGYPNFVQKSARCA